MLPDNSFSLSPCLRVSVVYDLNRLKFDFHTKQKRMRVTISEATIAFENDRTLPDIPAEAKMRLGLVEEPVRREG